MSDAIEDECDCDDGTVVRNIGEDRAAVLDCPDCSVDSAENAQSEIERLESELEQVRQERDEVQEIVHKSCACKLKNQTELEYQCAYHEEVEEERDELREKLSRIKKIITGGEV